MTRHRRYPRYSLLLSPNLHFLQRFAIGFVSLYREDETDVVVWLLWIASWTEDLHRIQTALFLANVRMDLFPRWFAFAAFTAIAAASATVVRGGIVGFCLIFLFLVGDNHIHINLNGADGLLQRPIRERINGHVLHRFGIHSGAHPDAFRLKQCPDSANGNKQGVDAVGDTIGVLEVRAKTISMSCGEFHLGEGIALKTRSKHAG